MIRLVALDVDGTLLNSRHALSPRTASSIRHLRAQGVQVCLATGKLFAAIQPLVAALELDGTQILCNGAVMAEAATGAIRSSETLGADEVAQVCAVLARHAPDLALAWYTSDAIYAYGPPSRLGDILAEYHEPPVVPVPTVETLPPPVKLLLTASHAALDALHRRVAPEVPARIHAVRTTPDFLEFVRRDVSKGTALSRLLTERGIRREEVVAFGDGENDIPLLQAAGTAVAMGNAAAGVAAHAQMRTASADDDGVAVALENMWREHYFATTASATSWHQQSEA